MALGVLVLVVVVSVMGGFERELKSRILGFTPHIVLQYAPGGVLQPTLDWNQMSEKLEELRRGQRSFTPSIMAIFISFV